MKITFIGRKTPHHALHSGYDSIMNFIENSSFEETKVSILLKTITKFINSYIYSNLDDTHCPTQKTNQTL
jgi:hypothetical protein